MKTKFVCAFFAAMAVLGLAVFLCFRVKDQKIESVEVEENGIRVKFSVFVLPKAMKIPAVYQPGDLKAELRKYSWLKPFLFSRFGIELYIPQEEWNEYAAYDWSEELYSLLIKRAEKLKEVVLDQDHIFWSKVKSEVSEVVLCETKDERSLIICVRGFKPDGTKFGSEYHKVVDVQGRWKRVGDNLGVLPYRPQQCHEKALKLVKDGELKTNPIFSLR